MKFETYLSSGYCRNPAAGDASQGTGQLILFNPAMHAIGTDLTVYFDHRNPELMASMVIQPESTLRLNLPQDAAGLMTDCGFWGLKVGSTSPVLIQYYGGIDQNNGQQHLFMGGRSCFQGTGLDREWLFPDGLWLEWDKKLNGEVEKAAFPFNELEHYHLFNPNPAPAQVSLLLHFNDGRQQQVNLTLPAERVMVWNNLDQVPFHSGYQLVVRSDQPVTCSAIRYIYGLRGFQEWGMHVHVSMWGIPSHQSRKPIPGGARS